MKRTTVYLSEEEAEGLRRAAAQTGKSQSELIREGIRKVTGAKTRRFHSMGIAEGSGEPLGRMAEEMIGDLLWQEYLEQRRTR